MAQAGEGRRDNDRSGRYKPKRYKPNQYKPNQYRPNQYKPDAPRRQERAPSNLYPRDEQDRRVLQQMMPHDRARRAVEQGQIRPLNEIRGQVKQQFNGRIVGVELYENPRGGRNAWLYDVRVLTKEGDVMAVEMDARTGRVMSVRGRR